MPVVLNNIANLLTRVETLFDLPGIDQPMFAAFHRLGIKLQAGVIDKANKKYLQSYYKAFHYNENIKALLSYILEAWDSSPQVEQQPTLGLRIALDVEKLIADTRSLLSELYQLSLHYQSAVDLALIPKRRRESFGGFADLFDESKYQPGEKEKFEKISSYEFQAPLSFLREIVPWGLTIRSLRDRYVHQALETLVFFVDGVICIDLDLKGRFKPIPVRRGMPELFYPKGNSNPLVRLDKLLVYIIAPVLALDQALGDFLNTISDYRFGDELQPSCTLINPRLVKLLRDNQDVLDPDIFKIRYSPWIATTQQKPE